MEHPDFDETTNLLADPKRVSDNLATDASPRTFEEHSRQFLGYPLNNQQGNKFREMLCTTDGLGQYFGQAILHRSTCDLHAADGRLLTDHLLDRNVMPIVKACGLDKKTGLIPDEDMQALPDLMNDCTDLGFHLMKVRNVINDPDKALEAAHQMAHVQNMAAKNGNVAIFLEPEFDRNNNRSSQENAALMTTTLRAMYEEILRLGVENHPWYLKTSYPTQGSQSTDKYDPFSSAEAYQNVLTDSELPEDLFIVQLSGGHTSVNARLLQQAVNIRQKTEGVWIPKRRAISTSYSRANLESPCQQMFPKKGAEPNVAAGQAEILRQGYLNRLAQDGKYSTHFEDTKMSFEEIWREVNPT